MFYKKELIHMLISVVTISLAFSLAFVQKFPVMLLTVGLGFILHEMAHKIVAIKLGCHAVYRAWLEGLVLAIVFAVATRGAFVFAAPGAVYIYKEHLTRREDGLISMAGPLTNLLLGLFFLLLVGGTNGIVQDVAVLGFTVNMFLGFFNMIPIGPLDGSKVMGWNSIVWAALFFTLAYMTFMFPASALSTIVR